MVNFPTILVAGGSGFIGQTLLMNSFHKVIK